MNRPLEKLKNISLKTELYLNLMLVVVVSVAASGFFAYEIAENSLKEQAVKSMDLAVENKEGQLIEFMEHIGTQARAFASDGLVINSTQRMVLGEEGFVVEQLNDHLATNIVPLDETLFGVNIIDNEGRVIASSHESEMGEVIQSEYLEEASSLEFGEVFISDVETTRRFGETGPTLRVFSPIVDPVSGDPAAFIVNYVNTDNLDDIMLGLRKGELSDTAPEEDGASIRTLNMYIVNKDGYIVTESRHGDYVPFEKQINTIPYIECQVGQETANLYMNYNNVPVVGSSTCLDNDWTLVAEIDEEEALAGIKVIQRNIAVLALLLVTIAAVIAYFLVRKNIKPIKKLSDAVAKFGEGDLSRRVEVGSLNEIGQLTQEFNRMADRLEELDSAKSEFISFVSHQYKNPLSVLSLNTELLLEDKGISKEQKDVLEMNLNTVKDLSAMVENFLNVSRIELGVFEAKKEEVDLVKLLEEVKKKFVPKAKKNKIELLSNYKSDSVVIDTDPHALGIIVENLISNAIKYTPEKGKVALEVETEEDKVLIRVLDTGCGIPKKDQPYIFSKFFRARNTDKEMKTEGTGLGLYMAKVLTEKLGGRVWFESKEKVGTTFYVSLPLGK